MNAVTRALVAKQYAEGVAVRAAFDALMLDQEVSWAEIDAANPMPAYVWKIKESARLYSLDRAYRLGYVDTYTGEDDDTEAAIERSNDAWASRVFGGDPPNAF
jgi:hypothetical protein